MDLREMRVERARLVVEKQQLETEMAEIRTGLLAFRQECMRRGAAGKAQWFDRQAADEARRTALQKQKNELERQLSDLKGDIIDAANAEHSEHLKHKQIVEVPARNVVEELWRLCRWASQLVGDVDWQASWSELHRWTHEPGTSMEPDKEIP